MEGRTIRYDQLDAELATLAQTDPHDAARIAAEALLDGIAGLQSAARSTPLGKRTSGIVKQLAPRLPADLVRLEGLLSKVVTDTAMGTHDNDVAAGTFKEDSYLRLVHKIGCAWLNALVLPTDVKALSSLPKTGVALKVDARKVIKAWSEVCHIAPAAIDTSEMERGLYREYRAASKSVEQVEWSEEDLPSLWAKRFGLTLNPFKDRIKAGKIHVDKVTARRWRVDVRDLPPTKR